MEAVAHKVSPCDDGGVSEATELWRGHKFGVQVVQDRDDGRARAAGAGFAQHPLDPFIEDFGNVDVRLLAQADTLRGTPDGASGPLQTLLGVLVPPVPDGADEILGLPDRVFAFRFDDLGRQGGEQVTDFDLEVLKLGLDDLDALEDLEGSGVDCGQIATFFFNGWKRETRGF